MGAVQGALNGCNYSSAEHSPLEIIAFKGDEGLEHKSFNFHGVVQAQKSWDKSYQAEQGEFCAREQEAETAPRAATSSKELTGTITGQLLLRLLRGLREQSRILQPPTRTGMHFQEAGNATFPSGTPRGHTTGHRLAVPSREAEVHGDPPTAASLVLPRVRRFCSSFPVSPILLAAFGNTPDPTPSTPSHPHLQGGSPDTTSPVCNRIKVTGVTNKAGTCLLMINPVSELYLQTPALPQSLAEGPQAVVSPYSWLWCAGSYQTPGPSSTTLRPGRLCSRTTSSRWVSAQIQRYISQEESM